MTDSQRRIALGAGLVVGIASAAWLYAWRRQRLSARSSEPTALRVTQLWIFPVKSCSGFSVQRAMVGKFGFDHDREWVIVRRSDSAILTQREISRMKLITATLDARTNMLCLEFPPEAKLPPQRVSLDATRSGPVLQLEKWKLAGGFREEASPDVHQALSSFLGVDVFLARAEREAPRNPTLGPYPTSPSDRILGHDFSTFHIATEEALAWVRNAANDDEIDILRFRPNIVVAGSVFPDEDHWKLLQLRRRPGPPGPGHSSIVTFRTSKGCTRCMIPTISNSAVPHPMFEPTKTLREQHALQSPLGGGGQPKPVFGLSCFHDGEGEVAVGDELVVLERYPK